MIQKLNLLYLTNNQRILTYNFIVTYLHKWNHSKQTNIIPRINIHVLLSVKREIHENKCLPFLGIELKTTSLFVFTMFSVFICFLLILIHSMNIKSTYGYFLTTLNVPGLGIVSGNTINGKNMLFPWMNQYDWIMKCFHKVNEFSKRVLILRRKSNVDSHFFVTVCIIVYFFWSLRYYLFYNFLYVFTVIYVFFRFSASVFLCRVQNFKKNCTKLLYVILYHILVISYSMYICIIFFSSCTILFLGT